MEKSQNTESVEQAVSSPTLELASYHQEMTEKYEGVKPDAVSLSPDALSLIAFNGYYTLNSAVGAFFAIDTNMYVQSGATTPIYDVTLLISLDGKKSARYPFTGTFDGTHLVQLSAAMEGCSIDLTFNRKVGNDGTTANCSGSITLPGMSSKNVSGFTYNNPIPASLFAGEYYEKEPLYINQNGKYEKESVAIPVMRIDSNNHVFYDFGSNDGNLKPVLSYSYNMNMYYFTFSVGNQITNLIMGTAAEGGFACNNMVENSTSKAISSRNLQTIPFPTQESIEIPNLSSNELAKFSGYYQLTSIDPKAFISIQAEYIPVLGSIDIYVVKIGVSLDGISSTGYYFDAEKMSFANNTLTMTDQSITIVFDREYNATQKSLVTITGTIGDQKVAGYTLFNPVPLSAFGGLPMTNSNGDSLTVVSDSEVIYNGVTMKSILYVPIMYILANPWDAPTTVMSFGTSGLKGNTCIVIQGKTTSVVSAIQ
jgi:hypothetical protein